MLSIPSIILLFLSTSWIKSSIQFSIPEKEKNACLKVLCYNVGLIPFDRLQTNKEAILDSNKTNGFLDLIRDQSPDILCLQEFHNQDIEGLDVLSKLNLDFGYEHYAMSPVFLKKIKGFGGPIILSKYPIVNHSFLSFEQGGNHVNHLKSVDILFKGDTIRIIDIHLASMSIRVENTEDTLIQATKGIYSKLKNGFQRQCSQIDEILRFKKNDTYKTIICGDLNSIPYAYPYRKLLKEFSNSFEAKGNGFGFTLNRFPYFVRIDNVFVSKDMKILSHNTLRKYKNSDHFPVLVEIQIK